MFRRAALSVLLLAPLTAVAADQDPQAVADYRHEVYESLAKHMKASSMIVKGKVDAKADLPNHARSMHEMARVIHDLFPEGTGPDATKTRALPEIWTKRDDFNKIADTFLMATLTFSEAAEAGDAKATAAAFGAVGKTCGECHDLFRKPAEKKP